MVSKHLLRRLVRLLLATSRSEFQPASLSRASGHAIQPLNVRRSAPLGQGKLMFYVQFLASLLLKFASHIPLGSSDSQPTDQSAMLLFCDNEGMLAICLPIPCETTSPSVLKNCRPPHMNRDKEKTLDKRDMSRKGMLWYQYVKEERARP